MRGKAIKLGPRDKHPANHKDLDVNGWHICDGMNVILSLVNELFKITQAYLE